MQPLRIVIIGGVAGGATAAARARRVNEDADITLIERGAHISYANCGLPYYIGGDITDRERLLLSSPERFWSRYRVRVRTGTEAVAIDRARRVVRLHSAAGPADLPYDRLVLSQGGTPLVPRLPGLPAPHAFSLRSVEDMDTIANFLREQRPRRAVVVGGGFIGLEMAEALHKRGLAVHVVEKAPQVLPNLDLEFSEMVRRHLHDSGITVHLGEGVARVGAADVTLESGAVLPADLVLLSVGVRPELTLAREAGLRIGPSGGVLVNGLLQTSDPDIYAVGDMAEIAHQITGRKLRVPLAGPANRQGRVAGSNAAGGREVYTGSLGTSIVKVCQRTVAATGLTERQCREAGLDAETVTVHGKSHAGYYPNAQPLTLKLIYLRGSGRLLGAQCLGTDGVDKRVDVLATAIAGHMTIEGLTGLDLCYAPPYSSANDPVNVAAFVAQNGIRGYAPLCSAAEALGRLGQEGALLLDVRDAQERARGRIEGSLHIPLEELRDRLAEIPRDRALYVHCQSGLRSYLAVRVLQQRGWKQVFNVSGGFRSLVLASAEVPAATLRELEALAI